MPKHPGPPRVLGLFTLYTGNGSTDPKIRLVLALAPIGPMNRNVRGE